MVRFALDLADVRLMFLSSVLEKFPGNEECFGGIIFPTQFKGTLFPDKKVDNKVEAVINFTAKDIHAESDVGYRLTLNGDGGPNASTVEDVLFPPEPLEVTIVRFSNASIAPQRKKEIGVVQQGSTN